MGDCGKPIKIEYNLALIAGYIFKKNWAIEKQAIYISPSEVNFNQK